MPLSIIVDLFINRRRSTFLVYLGMALIAVSFIGFCVSEFVAVKRERTFKKLDSQQQEEVLVTSYASTAAVSVASGDDNGPSRRNFVGQATSSQCSYLGPHQSPSSVLPINCNGEESQLLFDHTPPVFSLCSLRGALYPPIGTMYIPPYKV